MASLAEETLSTTQLIELFGVPVDHYGPVADGWEMRLEQERGHLVVRDDCGHLRGFDWGAYRSSWCARSAFDQRAAFAVGVMMLIKYDPRMANKMACRP